MPRPVWPPEYANVSIDALLDDDVPHGAFRFYAKLRALSWGEPTLSINFERLMDLARVSATRAYEYARILRDHHKLLSYAVRNNVFECSFASAAQIPGNREMPSPLGLESELPTKQDLKPKRVAPRISGKREKVDLFPLVEAMAEVCRIKIAANRGRLFREASELAKIDPPPTPELLREHYNGRADCFWRLKDWRGKKGENPTPAVIRETWGQWDTVTSRRRMEDPAEAAQLAEIVKAEKARIAREQADASRR